MLVTGAIFFGLFLIEYPPLFSLGYWAWPYTVGYTAHKVLSGLFIILNLGITQFVVRRWGFFRQSSSSLNTSTDSPAPSAPSIATLERTSDGLDEARDEEKNAPG